MSDMVIDLDAPALPYDDCPADAGELIDLNDDSGTFDVLTDTPVALSSAVNVSDRWQLVSLRGKPTYLPSDSGAYVWCQDSKRFVLAVDN
jgi:hypothetical protein